MLPILILTGVTFLWSKFSPEILFGILQGYSRDELKVIKELSFRNIIFYFGLEIGFLFIIIYLAMGFVFTAVLNKLFMATLWQQWLCFALLLALVSAPQIPANIGFWKRWAIYMGGAAYLFPELAQLSLALIITLSMLGFRKKYILWSSTIAGITIMGQHVFPYPVMGLMLATCLITSFGVTLNPIKSLVNNTIQFIVSPKQFFEQYNTLK